MDSTATVFGRWLELSVAESGPLGYFVSQIPKCDTASVDLDQRIILTIPRIFSRQTVIRVCFRLGYATAFGNITTLAAGLAETWRRVLDAFSTFPILLLTRALLHMVARLGEI